MENLEKMEAFLKGDLQYKSELFQEILQKEISSEETLIIAEAVLYFAKLGLHHEKFIERLKQNGRSEKNYIIFTKKCFTAVLLLQHWVIVLRKDLVSVWRMDKRISRKDRLG